MKFFVMMFSKAGIYIFCFPELLVGTHTITCTATGGNGLNASGTKDLTVEVYLTWDELAQQTLGRYLIKGIWVGGDDPNNYVLYDGRLWRMMRIYGNALLVAAEPEKNMYQYDMGWYSPDYGTSPHTTNYGTYSSYSQGSHYFDDDFNYAVKIGDPNKPSGWGFTYSHTLTIMDLIEVSGGTTGGQNDSFTVNLTSNWLTKMANGSWLAEYVPGDGTYTSCYLEGLNIKTTTLTGCSGTYNGEYTEYRCGNNVGPRKDAYGVTWALADTLLSRRSGTKEDPHIVVN